MLGVMIHIPLNVGKILYVWLQIIIIYHFISFCDCVALILEMFLMKVGQSFSIVLF